MFHQIRFGTLLVTALLGALLADLATASPPDILRNYRLIPRHSTLEVTGGFAGVNDDYNLFGTFGLVTGYRDGFSCLAIGCPPPPTNVPYAQFVDVDVDAILHNLAAFAPKRQLDEFFNLESLPGTFTDSHLLQFHGFDHQGAPFNLRARIHGRLIHLVGENNAPCCDLFNYKIDAYAHLAPFADFNFDGRVDAIDYTAWRNHLGMTSGATLDEGDADGDGDVDQDDYSVWRQDFGTTIDMSALADTEGLSLGAVPEPATISLLFLSILALVPRSRRFFSAAR
jgi:Dockerin type I domain